MEKIEKMIYLDKLINNQLLKECLDKTANLKSELSKILKMDSFLFAGRGEVTRVTKFNNNLPNSKYSLKELTEILSIFSNKELSESIKLNDVKKDKSLFKRKKQTRFWGSIIIMLFLVGFVMSLPPVPAGVINLSGGICIGGLFVGLTLLLSGSFTPKGLTRELYKVHHLFDAAENADQFINSHYRDHFIVNKLYSK